MTDFWTPHVLKGETGQFDYVAGREACVGPPERQFLMGGVAMAAAITALEQTIDKPLRWASMQFVTGAMLGDRIRISVEPLGGGRSLIQARALLHQGDRLLQSVSAALGRRDSGSDHQFAEMPNVPPAADCPPKTDDTFAADDNLLALFERRTALEDGAAGIELMWIRPRFTAPVSAALLALISDFLLGAHGRTRGGTSLDNTLRMHRIVQTEWVLCATRLTGFSDGAASGTMQLFAEDGTLLALSGQTGLLPRQAAS